MTFQETKVVDIQNETGIDFTNEQREKLKEIATAVLASKGYAPRHAIMSAVADIIGPSVGPHSDAILNILYR